ncbi:MAG: hypothetical protein H6R15_3855 [Proteobacteria bacterium]|nr:hypothetical protein [Pseudomonadota bacterium]
MNRPRSIREFLGDLDYLMGCCHLANRGDEEAISEIISSVSFVKQLLMASKRGLEKLQLFQEASDLIHNVEVLVGREQYFDADHQVLAFARMLAEVSGENDRLRKMYGGHKTNPNVH